MNNVIGIEEKKTEEKKDNKKTDGKNSKLEEEKKKQEMKEKIDFQLNLEKERKRRAEEEIKNKERKKRREKTSFENNSYFIKIFYTLPEFSGDKVFEFRNYEKPSNEMDIIYTRDSVIYMNDEHPNHLKKALVTQHNSGAGTNTVKFTIVFDDPPFVWELNRRTGDKIKTNKKIKVIKEVDFENLKKIGNTTNQNYVIKLKKEIKNKSNINSYLNDIYFDKRTNETQGDSILVFYQAILEFINTSIKNGYSKIIRERKAKEKKAEEKKETEAIEEKKEEKEKNITNYMKFEKEYIKDLISKIKTEKKKSKKKKELNELVWHFNTFFNLGLEEAKKIIDKVSENPSEEKNSKKDIYSYPLNKQIKLNADRAVEFFNLLLDNLISKKNAWNFSKGLQEQLNITTTINKFKFIQNLKKNREQLMEKNVKTVHEHIINELNKKINKLFYKGKQFYPELVRFKYSGAKNNDENTLIVDSNKLVQPTQSKIFRVNNFNLKIVTQDNDYMIEDSDNYIQKPVEKLYKISKFPLNKKDGNSSQPGVIEVYLDINLDVETQLSPEELLEQSKTKSTFQILSDVLSNVKNKMNCSKSKSDLNKNLKEIEERFKGAVTVPEFIPEKQEEYKDPFTIHTNYVKVTPNVEVLDTIIENNEAPSKKVNETKQSMSGGNKTLKLRHHKLKRNKTLKKIH